MKTIIKTKLLLLIIMIGCLCGNQITVMAQNATATIYLLKNQGFLVRGNPTFMINDVQVGELPKKSYYECIVPEGKLTVSVLYQNEQKDISIQVKGGEKYYLCADLKIHSIDGGKTAFYSVNISRMIDSVGEAKIKKCKSQLLADLSFIEVAPMDISLKGTYAQQGSVQSSTQVDVPDVKKKMIPKSDVDINIPKTNVESKNTFVLIIANENYEFVDDVEFAQHDGEIFREYCIKTLGVPERQVWLYKNASLGIISSGVNKMVQALNIFDNAKAIIYYCGHGIPDEKTSDAYIVPIDGVGTDVSSCYSLNELYKTMASAKASNVTYFMDACFSGANRDGSMLVAARGVARKAKEEVVTGKTVVFSAASGDETAMPFRVKGHGLFTYFLLKKLQETKGNVTYGKLAEYINENVKKEAFLTNNKPQNPVVMTSKEFETSWESVKIR